MADEPHPDESGWRLNLFNVECSPVRVSDNTAPRGRQATAGQACFAWLTGSKEKIKLTAAIRKYRTLAVVYVDVNCVERTDNLRLLLEFLYIKYLLLLSCFTLLAYGGTCL